MVNHAKKALKWVKTIKQGAQMLVGKQMGRALHGKAMSAVAGVPAYKKGGKVKRTGLAKVHAGEVVLTKGAVKTLRKLLK